MVQDLQERKDAFKNMIRLMSSKNTIDLQSIRDINLLVDKLDTTEFNALYLIWAIAETDGWSDGYDWGMHAMHKAAKEHGIDIEMP